MGSWGGGKSQHCWVQEGKQSRKTRFGWCKRWAGKGSRGANEQHLAGAGPAHQCETHLGLSPSSLGTQGWEDGSGPSDLILEQFSGFLSLASQGCRGGTQTYINLGQVLLASPSCAALAEISRLMSLAAEEILAWQHKPTSGCLARREMETSLQLRLCLARICLFGSPDSWAQPSGLAGASDQP